MGDTKSVLELGAANAAGCNTSACKIRSSSWPGGWVYIGGRSRTCSDSEVLIGPVDELKVLIGSIRYLPIDAQGCEILVAVR